MNGETIVVKHSDFKAQVGVAYEGKLRDYFVVKQELYKVRPMTDQERKQVISQRGRETFSYGKAVCVLPSARFYKPTEAERLMRAADREYEAQEREDEV